MKFVSHWFESLPIRAELTLLASLSSGLALVIAGMVLSIVDYHAGRQSLVHRLQTHAKNIELAIRIDPALPELIDEALKVITREVKRLRALAGSIPETRLA